MNSVIDLSVNTFNLYNSQQIKSEQACVSVAIEMPVALIYNGISHVVMMTLPKDLVEFAYGFSLSEGIIKSPSEIYDIEIMHKIQGIELHIEISTRRFEKLKAHRRQLAGRTGCGLCGAEQLAQVRRKQKRLLSSQKMHSAYLKKSREQLIKVQNVGQVTRCTHAAVWLSLEGDLIAGFEDIGRHVALDKLLGYRALQANKNGVILVSSRASYEMVQKAVQCDVEILLALSAVTSLAVEIAKATDLTLLGFLKQEKPILYSGAARMIMD